MTFASITGKHESKDFIPIPSLDEEGNNNCHPYELAPAAVKNIRRRASVGNDSFGDIAESYGITEKMVTRIVHRKLWANV